MQRGLQDIIDRMPGILEHNAPSMMRRMIAAMQAMIVERGPQANASHGALFLRVGEADLVREFALALGQVVRSIRDALESRRGSPPSLTLEPISAPAKPATDAFESSSLLFSRLCSKAEALGVIGCDLYNKDVFLKALKQAFEKARMDRQAQDELLHYSQAALNAELLKVYTKLDSVGTAAAQPR